MLEYYLQREQYVRFVSPPLASPTPSVLSVKGQCEQREREREVFLSSHNCLVFLLLIVFVWGIDCFARAA